MTAYIYSIASDFTGLPAEAEPCLDKLTLQIVGAGFSVGLDHIDRDSENVTFDFESALSAGEQTTLAGIVSGHDGGLVNTVYHASSTLVTDEKAITEVSAWQELGGIMTNPSYFIPDMDRALGRVVGMVKVDGTGVELRLTEDGSQIGSVKALDDASGAWAKLTWTTAGGVLGGDRHYVLEGRLGDAANTASIKHAALSLLELM
jgi:hypothetical protein